MMHNLILCIFAFYHTLKNILWKLFSSITTKSNKYTSITLKQRDDKIFFYKNIKNHIIDFKIDASMLSDTTENNNFPINNGEKIHFHHSTLNISGYFFEKKLKYKLKSRSEDNPRDFYCTKIYFLKNRTNHITNPLIIYDSLSEEKGYTICTNIICTPSYTIRQNLFRNKQPDISDPEKIYMNTFFNKEKDELWWFIKNKIHSNDHNITNFLSLNILLSGPPGSGKSSFIHRLALCITYDIIEIDLRVHSKLDWHNFCRIYCSSYIISYVEFDKTVDEIVNGNDTDKYLDKYDLIELSKSVSLHTHRLSISVVNDSDKIKTVLPELFYPGRFTTLTFGYPTIDTIQDISLFYFKQKIKQRLPESTTLSTCEIIQLALESNTFEKFSTNLMKII